MLIETNRLLIRDFYLKDAKDLFEILGDEETMTYVEQVYDFQKTQDFLTDFCIGQKGAVAAVHKEKQKVIGYILCKELEKDIYEIGWIFHRTYWRQGYAYEACSALIEYILLELGAKKIIAETADKDKSVKLMKKLGMEELSVEKDYVKDTRGNLRDFYTFELYNE